MIGCRAVVLFENYNKYSDILGMNGLRSSLKKIYNEHTSERVVILRVTHMIHLKVAFF